MPAPGQRATLAGFTPAPRHPPRHATNRTEQNRTEQNRTEQSDSNRAGTRCRHGIRANGWSRSKFVLIGTLTNSVPTIMVVTGTA
ncbi:hypothetical protein [Erwinia psidii]|uniref:hypothetical protein n=1 Tax=Erwinia psidii TaxID=69224 RepID=UPI000F52857D|nr:hypothetical protein [Erwinia psidii]